MNDQSLKQEHNLSAKGNLETLTDKIWNDLQGRVSRGAIQQALLEIMPKYEKATVTTFVPILIQRDTINTLRATLAQAEVEPVTEKKLLPEQTVGEPSPRGLGQLWRRLESLLGQLAVVER